MRYITREESLEIIKELKMGAGKAGDDKALSALEEAEKALISKGCSTCKYADIEPWQAPCYDCCRNHRDYWVYDNTVTGK